MRTHPIDLPSAYGPLIGTLEVPVGEIGLASFMRAVMPVGQRLVDLMEAAYSRAGRPASCAKGCAACCRQEVPVSAPEALVLAEFAASMPAEQGRGVAARFSAIRERIRSGGAGESGPEGTGSDVRTRGLAWFRQGLDCPFLEDEACLAHAHRPLACRNHLAFSEARHCLEPETGRVRVMNPRFSLGTVMALLAAEFMGREPVKFPLAALEDWMLQNPEYGESRFPSEDLARRFIGMLGEFCQRSLPASSPVTAPAPFPGSHT
ncbi:MAG: hypothetical protein JWP91_2147 [Fibrobacteres bacterium]|nr:hypothetical protein [Fibrobacterota bacterium]